MRYLWFLILISTAQAFDTNPNWRSPNGRYQVVAEQTDDGMRYRAVNRRLDFLPGTFPSDYWQVESCLASRVCWRPDSAYFAIEEARSGIDQAFSVARRTNHGFAVLPFDRATIMELTRLQWHHGFVTFDRWLPKNRMEVTISGDLNVSRDDFECRFVLALKPHLRVVSFRIVPPAR